MRDYLVLAIVFLSVPVALFSPYYGILVWSWIAYFNPHRYGWGIAHDSPIALIIAVPTLVGTLFAPKNHRIFVRETVLLAALWAWFGVTTYYISTVTTFAGHLPDAVAHLQSVSKILLMTFVVILLVTSKEKLRGLILIIIASFGFRALFAAIFVIKTGGQYTVWGPPGTFLEDNNDFALGLNMTIPMFFFMARAEQSARMRLLIRILMVCVIISVIGTYSRGGMVGLTVIILALILRSRHKAISLSLVGVGIFALVTFTASRWQDRMDNFAHGNLDDSAESRLMIWKGGWTMAQDYPITGGGFDAFTDPAVFSRYLPADAHWANGLRGPHSIYFQMLGEQGFVGFGLFLGLMGSSLWTLQTIRRQARWLEGLEWAIPYTYMFEVTLVAYMANGATLGRAYFDFFYEVIACVIVLKIVFRRERRLLMMDEAEPVLSEPELVAA